MNYELISDIVFITSWVLFGFIILIFFQLAYNFEFYEFVRCNDIIDLPINNGTNAGVPKC